MLGVRKTDDTKLDTAWRVMRPFLDRLAAKPETEAVLVLSSAASAGDRLPFDEQSDFDVALVIDVPVDPVEWRPDAWQTYRLLAARMPTWLPNFAFHVPVPWGRLEVNVHQLIYAYEADARTAWDDGKCEAYAQTGRILFDRRDRVATLVARKAAEQAAGRPARVTRLANRLTWDVATLPRRQAVRGEICAAHLIVAHAVDELLELCFLLAGRFVPAPKWRLLALRHHGLLDAEMLRALEDAIACDPRSSADLERRVTALTRVWDAIRASAPGLGGDLYRAFAAGQLQLRERTAADTARAGADEEAYDRVNALLTAADAAPN
jgi:hypothetical protein